MRGDPPNGAYGIAAYSQLTEVIAIQDLKPEWILS